MTTAAIAKEVHCRLCMPYFVVDHLRMLGTGLYFRPNPRKIDRIPFQHMYDLRYFAERYAKEGGVITSVDECDRTATRNNDHYLDRVEWVPILNKNVSQAYLNEMARVDFMHGKRAGGDYVNHRDRVQNLAFCILTQFNSSPPLASHPTPPPHTQLCTAPTATSLA